MNPPDDQDRISKVYLSDKKIFIHEIFWLIASRTYLHYFILTGLTQAPKNYHLYTCQGIKDAFYFDREKVRNKSIISLLKRCLGDFRYRALVTLRLCQYFFKKRQEIITSCANCTNSGLDAWPPISVVIPGLFRSKPLAAFWYCCYYSLTEVTRKSLAIKSVKPYTTVAGVPAKTIFKRTPKE